MPQPPGESTDFGVVLLHGGDVVTARHANAILGTFQLRLQRQEILVGFQVRIAFRHHHQPLQGRTELTLGLLELFQFFRIIEHVPIHLDGAHLGAGLGHFHQHFPLVTGIALHGIDQVGDQVCPALILVFHLRPGGFYLFVVGGNVVDATAAEPAGQHDQKKATPKCHGSLLLQSRMTAVPCACRRAGSPVTAVFRYGSTA